jgi:glycerol-3-phosphate dehydrogenase (NAD(P)+)
MADKRGEIAVIGAGSWGTALCFVLADAGWKVRLWARRPEIARAIQRDRRNPQYLAEFELPAAVQATDDLPAAIAGAEMVVLAVPSDGLPEICERLAGCLGKKQGVVSAAKGLEHGTGRRLSQVIGERLGEGRQGRIAVLSGPNLAAEVAGRVAAASVAACPEADFAAVVQAAFSTPFFRVYTNPDMVGVELGGALKNIVAIAAGACDGLGFGDNTKAALLTRGLAEITRLGVAFGAEAETFRGLSGVGDLVATCAGRKSRNHRVGYELAQGRRLPEILADMTRASPGGSAQGVAEGVETTRAAQRLAQEAGVEMPITAAVHAVLFESVSPVEAVKALMARSWRDELES